MLHKTLLLGMLLSISTLTASTISKVYFEGNVKIPTKKLLTLSKPYMGSPMDIHHADAIAKEVEAHYRKYNYALAYATVAKMDESDQSITIRIGKYTDFNALAVGEMKRREIKPGSINKIFFEGNERISTYKLMRLAEPSLGLKKTPENLEEIAQKIQTHYRSRRYELAYVEIADVDENGTVNVAIKKYPTFKARYAREGKI